MLEEDIAATVVSHFSNMSQNGKPNLNQFTVLAGIVARINGQQNKLISLATGTKCIGVAQNKNTGNYLGDSHAEVLCKRGLTKFILECMKQFFNNPEIALKLDFPLEFVPGDASDSAPLFRIKPTWKLYLYISDMPCGDASIYNVFCNDSEYNSELSVTQSFTGAKSSNSISKQMTTGGANVEIATVPNAPNGSDDLKLQPQCCSSSTNSMHEAVQQLGIVRTKSGRSDLPQQHRTSSMSCSDKICRWIFLGLQGYVHIFSF